MGLRKVGAGMTNPNDPAFEQLIWKQMPLTKREYFAGLAMQGMLASQQTILPENADKLALAANRYADALIAELNKSK